MDTADFLKRVWPAQGVYFLAEKTEGRRGWRHQSYDNATAAAAAALALDQDTNVSVYHALASYREKFLLRPNREGRDRRVYRVRENVSFLRSAWLDLDVGPTKPYASQRAASLALIDFVRTAHLPSPSLIVSSGTGMHVYWCFTVDVPVATWERLAQTLKGLCEACKLYADRSLTANPCTVLRPIGTTHRKLTPLPVRLLREDKDVDLLAYTRALIAAARLSHVNIQPSRKILVQAVIGPNADLILQPVEYPPSSAHEIIKHCTQLAHIATTRGNVEEPLWYASIGLLRFCTEAPGVVHDWSKGHPRYSEEETSTKIDNHARSGVGPTTCERFAELNPAGCAGCPHQGKIKSPISLGVVVDEAPPPADPFSFSEPGEAAGAPTLPPPPFPWVRTATHQLGVTLADGRVDIWCQYDVYPMRRFFDLTSGKTTIMLRCDKQADGITDFMIPAEIVANANELTKWMMNHGVYITGKTSKSMHPYLTDYMRELQSHNPHTEEHNQFGWREGYTKFVLGRDVLNADGPDLTVKRGAIIDTRGFNKLGTLETWQEVMRLYARPGMEPYQFAVACAFGAPLMTFSGYEGALIALISPEGGQGKTTCLHAINSVWGSPKDIGLQANDTRMAVLKRIGIHANLPVTWDEVSNVTGAELSDFAYQITQGRERRRLNSDGSEKPQLERWSTILTCTANQSLLSRLALHKTNADAEVHRIIEYPVRLPNSVKKAEAEAMFPLLFEHYGWAGDKYAHYLLRNLAAVKDLINKVKEQIDIAARITTKERYWSAVMASVLSGTIIARKIGLIAFEHKALFHWVLQTIAGMRSKGKDIASDTISILGAYFNQYAGNRLVVKRSPDGEWTIVYDLHGTELVYRVEKDSQRAFVDRTHFRNWLAKSGGDFHSIIADLRESGVMVTSDRVMSLGQGTGYAIAPTKCIELNTAHPKLCRQPTLSVVEKSAIIA